MRIGAASERGTQCQQRKARDELGLAGTWMALAQACQGHGAYGPSRSRDELRPLHRRHRPPSQHLQPLGTTGGVRRQRRGRFISVDHRAGSYRPPGRPLLAERSTHLRAHRIAA